jgi:large subunit ribosomal protein L18
MDKAKSRFVDRKRRAARIRKKIMGTPQRPRLSVRRSLSHLYAQIIDDLSGKSLVQVGSISKEVKDELAGKEKISKTEVARALGKLVALKAREKGIAAVVFDRKGYRYHGRIKAMADAARSNGLTL